MRKTLFAGLTQLDPLDPLSTDDFSFQAENPDIIDRLLELGARTHRHDGRIALADPVDAPTAVAFDSGGTIPGDVSIEFAYTYVDEHRGETAASPIGSVTTPAGIAEPTNPPGASADYTAGELLPDTYYYAITWLDGAGGETMLGPIVAVDVDPGYASAQVNLDGLTADQPTGAVGWKLYRARGGEDFHIIEQGSSDTLTDDGTLCPDCTAGPPEANTTAARASVDVTVPTVPAGAAYWQLYGRVGSDWDTFSFLASGTAADTVTLTSFSPTFGRPPARSLSVAGATQIDPDTDILDWHWKRPVAASGSLGSGSLGDVRLVTNSGELFGVLASAGAGGASAWTKLASGVGGGGAGSIELVTASGDGQASSPSTLIFRGSGSIEVDVQDLGGSALVTIDDGGMVYEAFGSAAFQDQYVDHWGSDDRSSYTYMVGASSDLTATGGGVRLAADTTNLEMYYASAGSDGDCRVGVKFPDDTGAHKVELIAADDVPARLWVESVPGGTTQIIAQNDDNTIEDVVASRTGTPAAAAGWLLMYRQGNQVAVEVWSTDPALGGTPAFKVQGTLTGWQATTFGTGKTLRPGWGFFRMLDTGDLYDDFTFATLEPIDRMTRVRSGSADRLLLSESDDTDFYPVVGDADGPLLTHKGYVQYVASGEVSVGVTDLGGGSARVTVHAPSAAAAGGGISGIAVTDADGPLLTGRTAENFAGSGRANVDVTDLGGGSAKVLVTGRGPAVTDADGPLLDNRDSVNFVGSGRASVDVTDLGGGSGKVLVTGRGPTITDEDGPLLENRDVIEFVGASGGIVIAEDRGGGSGRVIVSASGAQGPIGNTGATGAQGPQGSGAVNVTDADGPVVYGVGTEQFSASGAATVGVADLGGGSASVTISAREFSAKDNAGHVAGSLSDLLFSGSGGVAAGVTDLGGGSAQVTIGGNTRQNASATTGSLASGASGLVGLDLGLSYRLMRVRANKTSRVRIYAASAYEAADRGRAIGTDPSLDHGVLLDFVFPSSAGAVPADLDWTLTPQVDGSNLEASPGIAAPVNITNMDATGPVTVSFIYVRTE